MADLTRVRLFVRNNERVPIFTVVEAGDRKFWVWLTSEFDEKFWMRMAQEGKGNDKDLKGGRDDKVENLDSKNVGLNNNKTNDLWWASRSSNGKELIVGPLVFEENGEDIFSSFASGYEGTTNFDVEFVEVVEVKGDELAMHELLCLKHIATVDQSRDILMLLWLNNIFYSTHERLNQDDALRWVREDMLKLFRQLGVEDLLNLFLRTKRSKFE
ncbi:hypothetical protein HAX54_035526 [Datura stramonium]|uniref:Uncharacterized protein n=1 Tax=Datura stramonium TaxID=4076 RepID=A0ABS8VFF1_DATST|nr:hypothetical protein [Datura stramonium]